MSTYVIGDVQGCFDELQALLEVIEYQKAADTLWFAGDLVNRGPDSLKVLRFIKDLPNAYSVLGNHDLSLLALAYSNIPINHHTLQSILEAPDREVLLAWLRRCPLIYEHPAFNCILVHSGIPPAWSIEEACHYAKEVEIVLQGDQFKHLLDNLFGNDPKAWNDQLEGYDRLRFIINGLTRLRLCDQNGSLDFSYKGKLSEAPSNLQPWFSMRQNDSQRILFGHWAALGGVTHRAGVEALDTGCVWGEKLTALRLDDWKRFSVNCQP